MQRYILTYTGATTTTKEPTTAEEPTVQIFYIYFFKHKHA